MVEKVDEGAFHRKHMFQVEVVPSGPSLYHNGAEVVLYLQAAVSCAVIIYLIYYCLMVGCQ